ncbi:MAG: HisA/HisF-related TIM barrel protein [Anaerolineales bacterium]
MFTIYPAIDLRQGKVVRLAQGNAQQMTIYSESPAQIARQWLEMGARWLHVINLDGAFGEEDAENREALRAILAIAGEFGASIQFGGGLRAPEQVIQAFELGVSRVVLGTLAVKAAQTLPELLGHFGEEAVAVALDSSGAQLRIQGWQSAVPQTAFQLANALLPTGLRWFIFTDTRRDGLRSGLNLEEIRQLLTLPGIKVIASGGARHLEELRAAARLGCQGVILGRALYEGDIDLQEALHVS